MATNDILKRIVQNGSNLILARPLIHSAIREIAAEAKKSGAHLTITTELTHDIIDELSSAYGSSISFIEGLGRFEKNN